MKHKVVYLRQPSWIVWTCPSSVYAKHISLRLSTAKSLTSYVRPAPDEGSCLGSLFSFRLYLCFHASCFFQVRQITRPLSRCSSIITTVSTFIGFLFSFRLVLTDSTSNAGSRIPSSANRFESLSLLQFCKRVIQNFSQTSNPFANTGTPEHRSIASLFRVFNKTILLRLLTAGLSSHCTLHSHDCFSSFIIHDSYHSTTE
jgi:hypothetical protein